MYIVITRLSICANIIHHPIDNAGRDAGDFWLIMDKMAGKLVKRPLLPCLGFNSSYTDLG